jgi:FtsH-binding integral membrane protein
MFVRSSGLDFVISIIGVFVFLGLTAYDTQKLRSLASANGGTLQDNMAIFGALRLYLDFINLFLFMLRIFGGRRR